jgi:hypothetical protein
MRHPCIAVFAAFLVTAPFSNGPAWAERSREDDQHRASGRGDSLVLQWNEVALEAIRRSTLGPPIVARALAIVHTCIYDAWAAYDPMARGTQLRHAESSDLRGTAKYSSVFRHSSE